MKILRYILGLLLVAAAPVSAQLVIEVTLAQDQFLPSEAIPATVRISNRSGRTLRLGGDEEWLKFSVQERSGSVVEKIGEAPVLGEFVLETSQVASKKVDIAPYFALARPGSYHVIATVRIKEWDSMISSAPRKFDVIDGTKIWSQDFGVPAPDSSAPPELRRYSLLRANYLKSEIRLYFRLSDGADTKTMKVFPLGEVVSFGRPEARIDGLSRLHVLHQNGSHTSRHTVLNPDGDVVMRHLYEYVDGRPALVMDREGKITVAGAVRRPDAKDFPEPKAKE
jgi:hypothetical protein